MKKWFLLGAGVTATTSLFNVDSVAARSQYMKAFEAKYVAAAPQGAERDSLVAAVGQAKCKVCHTSEVDWSRRNDYGKALNVELREVGRRIPFSASQVNRALERVAKMPSDPTKPDALTFGERISRGQLPVENPPPEPKQVIANFRTQPDSDEKLAAWP